MQIKGKRFILYFLHPFAPKLKTQSLDKVSCKFVVLLFFKKHQIWMSCCQLEFTHKFSCDLFFSVVVCGGFVTILLHEAFNHLEKMDNI